MALTKTLNGALAGLGPALTTILLTADVRMGWDLGKDFWGAVLVVMFTFGGILYAEIAQRSGKDYEDEITALRQAIADGFRERAQGSQSQTAERKG